jgi:hypothetical protein
MTYELFNIKSQRIGSPALTITADLRMVLNADAGDLLRREGAKFIQILWDAKTYKVALRPLTKRGQSSYKLSSKSGRRGMGFSGATFLRHIRWNSTRSSNIPIEWNEEEKILEASLPHESIGQE